MRESPEGQSLGGLAKAKIKQSEIAKTQKTPKKGASLHGPAKAGIKRKRDSVSSEDA